MQAVAAEMNLSEIAFVVQEGDGYRLRWFTPKIEVDLCGHATLASAHVLWTEGYVPLDTPINFHTKSGWLKAVRRGERIELDFPLDPPSDADTETPLDLWAMKSCGWTTISRKLLIYLYLAQQKSRQWAAFRGRKHPLGESNPCFRTENPTSSATRRRGRMF